MEALGNPVQVPVWSRFSTEAILGGFEDYLLHELGRSPRTVQSYKYSLQCGSRFIGKPAPKVTSDDLRTFKRESDYSPATKQQVIVAFHQLHLWMVLEGHCKQNGILAVRTPKIVRVRQPPLTVTSIRKLLEACHRPLDFRVVYLGLYGGLRIFESASITRENWLHDRLDFIGKGRKPRQVPIHPELAKVRDEILSKTPKSQGVLQSSISRLRDETEATDERGRRATSHGLRRTCGSWMYDKGGVPWEVISKLLGHGEDVTAIYVKIPWEKMVTAIESINYYTGDPIQLELF